MSIDAAEIAVLQSGAWTSFVTNGGTALAKLGINATADLDQPARGGRRCEPLHPCRHAATG